MLPDLPTVGEFIPEYEASDFYGVGRPKTRRPTSSTGSTREINAWLNDPVVKARLADLGGMTAPGTRRSPGSSSPRRRKNGLRSSSSPAPKPNKARLNNCHVRRDVEMKPRTYGPFPYSLISRRPRLQWPNGARVALWVVPNVEIFSLMERPGGLGPGKIPDIPTWAVRDYGNRVGISRVMKVLDRYGIRATVALNSDVCIHHPRDHRGGRGAQAGSGWATTRATPYASTRCLRRTRSAASSATRWRRSRRRPASAPPAGSARACRDLEHARTPGRRRLRLRRRLGRQRRPALRHDLGQRKDAGLCAVQLRHQRQASFERRSRRPRLPGHDRPAVRRALPRGRRMGA